MTFIQPVASHFINGRYVDDTTGPVLGLIYPATGQLLGNDTNQFNAPLVKSTMPRQIMSTRSTKSNQIS